MHLRAILSFALFTAIAMPVRADDWAKHDIEALREAGVGGDGPSLLAYLRERTPTEPQRALIDAHIKDFASESFRVRQRAVARLEAFGITAVGALKQARSAADPEIVRQSAMLVQKIEKVPSEILIAVVARSIARLKPDGAVEVLLAQLPAAEDDHIAEELRKALNATTMRAGKPDERIAAALRDNDPARRAAAAEALIHARIKEFDAAIRALLKDNDAGVRAHVALTLVTVARDQAIVPELIRQLADAPPNKVWPAEAVLLQLAGDEAPAVSLVGPPEVRVKARDAWAAWWTKRGRDIDLKKLDDAPRSLGFTLIAQMDLNGTSGEVKEFAPDGRTVRWRVRELQFPIDAHFLPQENRLLVAEHVAQQVTERDMDGKILRRWPIVGPVACRRLANGNTFIGHRNGLMEFDAQNEKVFDYVSNRNDIVAANKGQDGNYAILTRSGQCMRINGQREILKTFAVGRPYVYSQLELLPNNRVLLTQVNGVAEYDLTTGKLEWSALGYGSPTSVQRLANGHTLIASTVTRKIVELDREGKLFNEFALPDGAVPWRVRRR